jgi:single-stranded DNA-binding protein
MAQGGCTFGVMGEAGDVGAADETTESVLEAATAAGHALSRDQLIRFHQHGLIPRPRQVSRGPGGGRRKMTVYPSGTAELVVRICELRDRIPEHRLDELGWLCWWHELPVPDCLARDYLNHRMAGIRKTAGELLTDDGVDVTAFNSLVENVAESLAKGMRVVVVGRIDTYKREIDTIEGAKQFTTVKFIAQEVSPSLVSARAKVTKVIREQADPGNGVGGRAADGSAATPGSGGGAASGGVTSQTEPAKAAAAETASAGVDAF